MKKLLGVATLAVVLSASVGAGTANAAVHWPAKCKNMRCVNQHLNALRATQVAQARAQKALNKRLANDEFGLVLALEGAVCDGDDLVSAGMENGSPIAGSIGFDCTNDWWSNWSSTPLPHSPSTMSDQSPLRRFLFQLRH